MIKCWRHLTFSFRYTHDANNSVLNSKPRFDITNALSNIHLYYFHISCVLDFSRHPFPLIIVGRMPSFDQTSTIIKWLHQDFRREGSWGTFDLKPRGFFSFIFIFFQYMPIPEKLIVAFVVVLITYLQATTSFFILGPALGGWTSLLAQKILFPLNVTLISIYVNYYLACKTDPGHVPDNWVISL